MSVPELGPGEACQRKGHDERRDMTKTVISWHIWPCEEQEEKEEPKMMECVYSYVPCPPVSTNIST